MIDERKLIFSKVDDILQSINRGRNLSFTSFLSFDECAMIKPYLAKMNVKFSVFGGYSDSERCIIGLTTTDQIETYLFPIDVLRFKPYFDSELSHRDVLGSLMSIGLKREMFGDILFVDGWWYIFCIDRISDFVIQNFISVKNISISVEKYFGEITFRREFQEINVIVSSMRLDCIVSELSCVSRTMASELISTGKVILNGLECFKKDKVVKIDDIISVKRKGKYRIFEYCGNTKKDKLKLKILKYI